MLNADGTLKNKESSHKEKKAHKAFAQLLSPRLSITRNSSRNSLRRTSPARRRRAIILITLPILTAILPEGVGQVAQRNYV
jgi:hypothetical protein